TRYRTTGASSSKGLPCPRNSPGSWWPALPSPLSGNGATGGVQVLAAFFVISYVLTSLHPLKEDRYIMPVIPPLWPLASAGLVVAAGAAASRVRYRAAQWGLALGFMAMTAWGFLPGASALYERLEPVQTPSFLGQAVSFVLDSAASEVLAGRSVLVIGTFAEISPPLLTWTRMSRAPHSTATLTNDEMELAGKAPPEKALDDWLGTHPGFLVITAMVEEGSPLYTNDYRYLHGWKAPLAKAMEGRSDWRQAEERYFPEAALRVRVYVPPGDNSR
ncbi:MAG: hypothetical protein Q8P59_13220, partial [Dehalococcoidia bacterium]|nr:hypothetical protein [Dehalococcoidia bacterium]